MNEFDKYGVELELQTRTFKQKLKDLSDDIKKLGREIKENSSIGLSGNPFKNYNSQINKTLSEQAKLVTVYKAQIDKELNDFRIGKIDATQAEKSLNKLFNEFEYLNRYFNQGTKANVQIGLDTSSISELQDIGIKTETIERNVAGAKEQMQDLDNETKNVSKSLNETSSNSRKFGNDIETTFKKALQSSRTFIFSLFSLRSVWSLVSRSASNYLAIDERLRGSSEITSNVMGNILAPAIKKVVDWGQYAVIVIAKLIQFFTGYNALAKTTTKNVNKLGQTAKSVSKILLGFDEITNLDESSGGLSSGVLADLQALDDFQKKVEEVSKWFDKWSQSTFAQGLKNAVQWFVDLDPALKAVILTLPALLKLLGGGNLGLLGLLGAIAVVSWIEVFKQFDKLKALAKETNDILANLANNEQKNTQRIKDNANALIAMAKAGEDVTEALIAATYQYEQNTLGVENNIKSLAESKNWLGALTGTWAESRSEIIEMTKSTIASTNEFYELYKQGLLNENQTDSLITTISRQISILNTANSVISSQSDEYKENEKQVRLLQDRLTEVTLDSYAIKLGVDTSEVQKAFNNIFNNINKLGSITLTNSLKMSGINSYAVGTNYVPNDQLAIIHEGEQVVPKRYNPDAGYNGRNDDLMFAIQSLGEAILNQPAPVIDINGRELARATYSDFEYESRRVNKSSFVSRY